VGRHLAQRVDRVAGDELARARSGTPGGYGATSSALIRPAGTVSFRAKNAFPGASTVCGRTIHAAAAAGRRVG
jgi:hypothetical protein